jgi:hypothetical protein
MAEQRNGYKSSLMDRNVPSQLFEEDLSAELEIELPDSQNNVTAMIDASGVGEIEIVPTEDGGVEIDFEPQDQRGENEDFYANLAEEMPDRELQRIASELLGEYDANKASRQDWEDAYANGLELLGFTYEERTQPFRGASGVTHPLLAEAATQFQAQAFNELLPPAGPVRTVVMGSETREKVAQAQRVKSFMNYYITSVMEEYTPDMDQMLFYLPLAGSTFKKTYYDETLGRAVSKFVPAENLVVPYETADLESCPNITQVVRMSLNDLRKRQLAGLYLDVEVIPAQREITGVEGEIDRIDGVEPSQIDYDCTILECHVDLDLEGYEELGEDGEPTGIRVPYIVTLSMDNGQVLSVRRNYREDDKLKKKIQYFTHFKFLPGFGFYGLGLIHTIGGLSRTATAALRQLIDAGTLSNLPAGFKARGLRIRDDDNPLQPGEFRDVDAPGGAIRDSLMPLPFKGPDQTLFNLLGFVVQAGQRFATITDLKVGDGNQQAPVGTTIAMMEQGSRVMSAVHKRLHYAMRQEFKILARVMSEYLPQEYPYSVAGGDEALGVADVDRLMKAIPAEIPEPLDPAQENINALDMLPLKAFEGQNHQAHIMAHLVFGSSQMVAQMPPVAISLQKHVMEHVQIAAREQAAVQYLQQVQQQGGQPANDEQMLQIEQLTAQLVAEGLQQVKQMSGELSGAGAPDPLVQLKEQELQLKAQSDQADNQIDQAKVQLDQQSMQMRSNQFQRRLASQEKQTQARIQSAMERELLKQRNNGGTPR